MGRDKRSPRQLADLLIASPPPAEVHTKKRSPVGPIFPSASTVVGVSLAQTKGRGHRSKVAVGRSRSKHIGPSIEEPDHSYASADAVASAVFALGESFGPFACSVRENGVDGAMIAASLDQARDGGGDGDYPDTVFTPLASMIGARNGANRSKVFHHDAFQDDRSRAHKQP